MEHVTEQQLTRRQSTVWRALRAAAPQTIPVLAGYFVLGMGYGIYVQSLGLPVWMPMLMGTVVYGGSLEFVLASLLLSAFSPLSAFLMALMIQARHLFYGLAAPLACLVFFGSGSFLLPSMGCILILLLALRKPIEKAEGTEAEKSGEEVGA